VPSDRNPVPAALGIPDAPRLHASASGGSGMSFFELDCFQRNIGFTKPVRDDAFLIALQLKTCGDFDLYAEGRLIQPQQFDAGAVAIFDLRTTLASDLRDPFHAIDLYLPLAALNAISDELGTARVDELRHTPGTAVLDTTVRGLLLSMQPALAAPPEYTSPLFVDHVAQAIATHVAQTYGGLRVPAPPDRGGLAPIQARRAKELLNANLSGRVLLTDLASVCNLSVRHFTRAFRQTTGMAPHQWLVRQRIEKAKDLLSRSTQPIALIASNCGFADQSHFTRVFSRAVGMPPAEWRRIRRR
jgi:AraC family transcriptional regulator